MGLRRLVLALLLLLTTFPPTATAAPKWVASWGSAMQTPVTSDLTGTAYTVRNVVHLSVGGAAVRLRLSNLYGDAATTFGRVTVAAVKSGAEAAAKPVPALFGGKGSVRVAAGREVLSDAVPLKVGTATDLLVSVYVSAAPKVATYHRSAYQRNYFAGGDHAAEQAATAFTTTLGSWYYLSEVAVDAPAVRGSVVAIGDSITDGSGSTSNANRRWPNYLANRVPTRFGVVDSGISGNELLHDGTYGEAGTKRFARDVLARGGVKTAIVLEGINDIKSSHASTAAQLKEGYRSVIAQAHAKGVRVLGATITPMGGYKGYTEAREAVRAEVNGWIRTGGEFDGVVDFDAAVRDPAKPTWLRAEYAKPDYLHLTDAGYQAMGNAVDLALLT
jgi:lysophospholipase L1-like esterase